MATKTTTLAVKIVSDASKAGAGFDDAESRVDKFNRRLDKASVAAGGVIGGLAVMGKAAFDAASELQQSTGAIDSVFGDWALDIEQAAQKADQAVGLSTSAYENMASVIGAQLGGMGMAHDEMKDKTEALIERGADLAATFGGTTADAVSALSSVLKGETDPIERYGISIKQADISARLAAEGQDKLTGTALKTATANAALALVAEQSASSVGAFGRESDTAAGQTQRASAAFDNAKASLGEALLPVVAEGAQKLSELAHWAGENQGTVQALALVIGGLALAVLGVNAAMSAYRAIAAVATAAQWLWNIAMDANPIGLVVLLIAGLVAAVVVAYNKFSWFRDIVKSIWEWLKKAWDFAGKVIGAVGDFFSAPAPGPGGGGRPGPAGGGGGVYGAAAGSARSMAPVYGAAMTSGGGAVGGLGSPAGSAAAPTTVINVTVNGALDPVAVGRQLDKILKDYGASTGRQASVAAGGRW